MIVKADAETLANQVANHWAGPHSRGEARRLRPSINEGGEFSATLIIQTRRVARGLARQQALGTFRLEPLQPAVDRTAGNVEFGAQRNDRFLSQVAQHGFGTTPGCKVASLLRIPEELAKFPQLLGATPTRTNCLPILGSRHDRLRKESVAS